MPSLSLNLAPLSYKNLLKAEQKDSSKNNSSKSSIVPVAIGAIAGFTTRSFNLLPCSVVSTGYLALGIEHPILATRKFVEERTNKFLTDVVSSCNKKNIAYAAGTISSNLAAVPFIIAEENLRKYLNASLPKKVLPKHLADNKVAKIALNSFTMTAATFLGSLAFRQTGSISKNEFLWRITLGSAIFNTVQAYILNSDAGFYGTLWSSAGKAAANSLYQIFGNYTPCTN